MMRKRRKKTFFVYLYMNNRMNFSRSKNDREADWNCDAKAQKADWDILYRAFSAPAFSNNCHHLHCHGHHHREEKQTIFGNKRICSWVCGWPSGSIWCWHNSRQGRKILQMNTQIHSQKNIANKRHSHPKRKNVVNKRYK